LSARRRGRTGASLPIACRLYLPEDWAADANRRKRAKVPADITFKTKPQIALDQIKAALAEAIHQAPSGAG
jgi:SRSO17 transposase